MNLLPKQITNEYKGTKIALYIFYLITLITIIRSLIHIFALDGGAQSIATIPLGNYPVEASATIISMFAFWGLSQLMVGVIYAIVSIKYRSLIPLMYLLTAFEYLSRGLITYFKPFEVSKVAPGGVMNVPATILALILFALSINKNIIRKN